MKPSFFARPVRVFGNVAVLVLCAVFFAVPFAMRGARMSLERMENNVKDWLPSDFPETKDLEWFGDHFVGERFVLVTWPDCTEDDERFQLLLKKLTGEVVESSDESIKDDAPLAADFRKARKLGDRLGLFATGTYDEAKNRFEHKYHENWGGRDEKWLLGDDNRWYFITPDGQFYRWNGSLNISGFAWRGLERLFTGQNTASGELLASFGLPSTEDAPNPFHADPRKLTARFFKTIETGPDVLARLAEPGGALWPRGDVSETDRPLKARSLARERLTGTLFAPAVRSGFTWKLVDFSEKLPQETREQLPYGWEDEFNDFVEKLVEGEYEGDRDALVHASPVKQSEHWDAFFYKVGIDPPARQTCAIVTLSEAGKRNPKRAIGRALLGEPLGRLLAISTECGVRPGELKLGGPPVDNVAIDEEGTITLFNLIVWSAALGISLSYFCFRSIKITVMVFFVGGVSAVTSLGFVWWTGASVDAVLMSMPALVYVLGLSGAVHIVNYYREAVRDNGLHGASESALAHGWGPCTLAAFTTALGLMSLYASNLAPIKKFGLYSAIGVMATLTLLFTYLPSALQIWPPDYKRKRGQDEQDEAGVFSLVERFWQGVGRWVIRRHALVTSVSILMMVAVGIGLTKIDTSVQLLKLFDEQAKIIRDYDWLEDNFGKLVPMELVVQVDQDMILAPVGDDNDEPVDRAKQALQHDFLERMEFTQRIQSVVEKYLGEQGADIVGQGVSAATFAPTLPSPTQTTLRSTTKRALEENRHLYLAEDYLSVDEATDEELWRISLRLGALNDVDYGDFVSDLRQTVEPALAAHKYRGEILQELQKQTGQAAVWDTAVLVLGVDPLANASASEATEERGVPVLSEKESDEEKPLVGPEEQTEIFAQMLNHLLRVEGFRTSRSHRAKLFYHDPERVPLSELPSEKWAAQLGLYNVVVMAADHPDYDLDFIKEHAKVVIDARDHRFEPGISVTAAEQNQPLRVVYTGVVPVVYKAQRTLLDSLINSIGLAFVMIAAVMMVLLRDWRRRLGPTNVINVSGGLLSMIPNVFPVVLVFGAMGHAGLKIDIGTMMTASVAMGVAVDDTIHFLTWFRIAIRRGMDRNSAITEAYRRVATAMTQTTLIGGLGLSVFALSTFTPTQQFGVMMVTLLSAALVGDLIILPALLAGPLGRCFCPKIDDVRPPKPLPAQMPDEKPTRKEQPELTGPELTGPGETAHSSLSSDVVARMRLRGDVRHNWPRH